MQKKMQWRESQVPFFRSEKNKQCEMKTYGLTWEECLNHGRSEVLGDRHAELATVRQHDNGGDGLGGESCQSGVQQSLGDVTHHSTN